MDSIEAIKTRRSIRRYKDIPVAKQAIESIVDAARYAPTARDVQPWVFIAVTQKEHLRELGRLADHGPFIADCAACIAVFCEDTKYYLEDGSAATQNIMLAARSFGIGSCWVAGDKKPYAYQIARILAVPAEYRLVSLVSLGYPSSEEEFSDKPRKQLQDLLRWEKF